MLSQYLNRNVCYALAVILAVLGGIYDVQFCIAAATSTSEVFLNLLKLVSLPIIFLSVVSTALGMENVSEIKSLGGRVIKYTLLTTVIAASVALVLFLVIDPVKEVAAPVADIPLATQGEHSYFHYLIHMIPSNIVQPFSENNVIGVFILAMFLSCASLSLPQENRKALHLFFSSIYAAVMKLTSWIILLLPIAIWAFITLFIRDVKAGMEMKSLAFYLLCVLAANIIQAVVVLPLLLKSKGISPMKTAKGMLPALSVAFFSKSSSAALPMAVKCAEENLGVSRKIASFSLPLCTTINMNACAAYILTTVLFVSMSNGVHYTPVELLMWVVMATVAAVGNAGVPMGCFFLSGALLAAMNVPLTILGIILPFYSLIDMLESAINVWSDACVRGSSGWRARDSWTMNSSPSSAAARKARVRPEAQPKSGPLIRPKISANSAAARATMPGMSNRRPGRRGSPSARAGS